MAKAAEYPDFALEKLTGLDPSENAQNFFNLIQGKIQFPLGTRPPGPDPQAVWCAIKIPFWVRFTRTKLEWGPRTVYQQIY